jgi:DNA mismatch repair protein MutL
VLRQRFAGPQGALPQTGLSPFHRFFGQVLGRYFVAETDEGFVLIDQHAAHQQILRAQWQEWWSKRRVPVVRRDPPVAVDVPKKTVKLLQEGRTLVQALGLDLEAFGGTAFLVRAVPEVADHVPAQDLVVAAVMALVEASDQPEEQRPLRVIEALTRQCALPAGKVMDAEAQADFVTLLQAWLPTLNAPEAALAEVTLGDLEKMFQRR